MACSDARFELDALYDRWGSLCAAVTETLPETSVTVFDRGLRVRMACGASLRSNGRTPDGLDGKPVAEALAPAHHALLEPLLRRALDGERSTVDVADGARTLWTRIAPLEHAGAVIGGVAISVDITDRKRREDARSLVAAIVEQAPNAIVGIAPDDTIFAWSAGAERLLRHDAGEAVGAPLPMLVPDSCLEAELGIWERVRAGETVERQTQRLRRDGTLLDLSVTGSPIRDAAGRVIGASEIARDISEERRVQRRLEHLADHDPLTGLLNRRAFENELSAAVAFARRYEMATCLLMIDVDRFKSVNDSYGHSVGDAILRRIGELLRGRLRATDVVARLGGDEFAAILPGLTAAEGKRVAEGLLGMVEADTTTTIEDHVVQVTASVGLVEALAGVDMTPEELLVRADVTLYEAKEAGRGMVSVADLRKDEVSALQARLDWAERIGKAREAGGFVLFEQPILTLATGDADRREVLLRLRSEHGELVEAGTFVSIAERFSHMPAIDLWVIRHVLDELESQHHDGNGTRMHINLSGASIGHPRVLSSLTRWIEAAEVDPRRLVFEIAESAALESIEQAENLCRLVRGLGCEVALDDFGSGFGALCCLKRLPFDCLKIDGGLIGRLGDGGVDRIAVRAMVDMARGLGKATIAKAVEDARTLALVRELGIDHAQGYHIGRPAIPAG